MTTPSRLHYLEAQGLLHPHPGAVTAPLFAGPDPFFLSADKVQVKYEMLRAHAIDGLSVVAASSSHGYSRPSFYLVAAAFAERGMAGLVDERPGRRGPLRLSDDVVAFVRAAPASVSGAELARQVSERFGVKLHRRTVEKARRR